MGRQIYLSDQDIKWLEQKLITLSGIDKYWDEEEEKKMLDRIYNKVTGDAYI